MLKRKQILFEPWQEDYFKKNSSKASESCIIRQMVSFALLKGFKPLPKNGYEEGRALQQLNFNARKKVEL